METGNLYEENAHDTGLIQCGLIVTQLTVKKTGFRSMVILHGYIHFLLWQHKHECPDGKWLALNVQCRMRDSTTVRRRTLTEFVAQKNPNLEHTSSFCFVFKHMNDTVLAKILRALTTPSDLNAADIVANVNIRFFSH